MCLVSFWKKTVWTKLEPLRYPRKDSLSRLLSRPKGNSRGLNQKPDPPREQF